MLGAAGLVAYGWRGGLAGTVIGAAVGLPHFKRIGTLSLSHHRTLDQLLRDWNREIRIGHIRSWVIDFQFAAGDPDSYRGALPVTAGAAATVGVLLGSSDGLVSGLTYGVATAVAVLTAVILCIGYGYTIRNMQSVAPREGSGEVPSPIARAVMRRGLLAVPLVSLATPILPGLLVAWLVSSADGVRFAAVVAIGAAMPTLVWFGGFAVVEQAMVRREFRRLDLAPLPLRPFLDYATQCLFLRQVGQMFGPPGNSQAAVTSCDGLPAERASGHDDKDRP